MAVTYLVDTNVIIDYTSNKFAGRVEQRLDAIFNEEFHYSIISRIEVLGYDKLSLEMSRDLALFLSSGILCDVRIAISDKTIEIKNSVTKRKLPDLIIAATALVYDLTLLTNNVKDFRNVPGIKLDNPWDW